MNKKVVVFAPHPDDETFGCGGVIAKRLSEGYEVLIVVLTDGRNAFSEMFGISQEPTPDELKEIRREELKRAVRILGVLEEDLSFLDFEDGTLEKNEAAARKKVVEILRKSTPAEIYFTYEGDSNVDHRVTSRMIKSCVKELDLDLRKYQYSIGQKYDRIGPIIETIFSVFRHNMIRVDISGFLSLKKAAIKEFKSEITIMSGKQQRPIMDNIYKFLKNEEIFFIIR